MSFITLLESSCLKGSLQFSNQVRFSSLVLEKKGGKSCRNSWAMPGEAIGPRRVKKIK